MDSQFCTHVSCHGGRTPGERAQDVAEAARRRVAGTEVEGIELGLIKLVPYQLALDGDREASVL
eukprot:396704-Rhodomonas_salina.1